jgi:hypothetical protein
MESPMTPTGSAPEPRAPFALPVRVVQPSEEARRMGRYEAVLCDANNVRIARVECFLPHDKPYHVIDATAPTADFIADAINAQPLGGAYTPPLGEPTWTDPLGMLASLCEEIRCAHRDPDDDDYNECEKDECAWCSDSRTAIDQLRLRVAPPREPGEAVEGEDAVDGLIARLRATCEGTEEGVPCICDGDNVALQVLCRAFHKEDPADLMEEWRAFDKSGWFWWGRALGAFIGGRIDGMLHRAHWHDPALPPSSPQSEPREQEGA